MILQERELTIRSAVPDDAEILTAWWNDGAVMAHAGFPNGLGTTAVRVRAQIRRNEPGVSELLIVLCGGVPIGEMNYRSESKAFAEIGIKLCVSSMQNQGLGKRLLALLLEQLFELGFRTIRLDTNPNNLRAMHVYETLGFRRLGIRVDSWTDQLGRLQSAVDYELRPEDLKPWLNRNKPINTPRLLLAKGRPGDWRDLYENVWSHPETARYMYWSVTEDPADAPARMQRTIGFQAAHDGWCVYEKQSGQAIGFANLDQVDAQTCEEGGIALGPRFVGKGYGTEILQALLDRARFVYGAKRFRCSAREQNAASRRLIESFGFLQSDAQTKTDERDGSVYQKIIYEKEL